LASVQSTVRRMAIGQLSLMVRKGNASASFGLFDHSHRITLRI
jgi:hypothetical protein